MDDIRRSDQKELLEWTVENSLVIAHFFTQVHDRGAKHLTVSMEADENANGPSPSTVIELIEFKRALLQ